MYFQFDFIGPGAAVLIRGLEPSEGEDLMRKARSVKKSDKNKELTCDMLCNGPAKLTQVMCCDRFIKFQDRKVLPLQPLSSSLFVLLQRLLTCGLCPSAFWSTSKA